MEIYVTQEEDSEATLTLKGRFDFGSNQQFSQMVKDLVGGGTSSLTVDLSGLIFIDSSGLEVLHMAREIFERGDGSVSLTHTRGYVQHVLQMCRFEKLFQVDW